eukprot:CAMPEP_0113651324 /NCGR_PEP_ID=MMETSP0017_2-20120614/27349_1 /TAXON_ID=2856 /ORGANISM="Cylindrotheca closterium" /LENGTH=610 /DNA_ID=CAMNT_0000563971 /DNA_START=186 /DNA_END=2018 /DNA_ORIENTATION=- /assembly_acc=CAM_ASM_000147
MAFNFGSTTPAPATPGFGATPAPGAPSAFSFGGAPTPAPGTPAPAPGGFFGGGGAPAPGAPAPGLFGSTPAPTPAGGGLFGAKPAPAPGGFGAPAPGNSLFGAPAPAPGGFGAPAPGLFGGTQAPAPGGYGTPSMAPAAPPVALAGHIPYANLPPDQKRDIDTLYQAMMQHKRNILQVSTMAPKLLQPTGNASQSAIPATSQADAAAGQDSLPLASNVSKLQAQMQNLKQQLLHVRQRMEQTQVLFQSATTQSIMFAKWPTEAVAMRRGVTLSKPKSATSSQDANVQAQLKDLLDREAAHVDRVERMPSPYLWQTLEQLEKRIALLQQEMTATHKALQEATSTRDQDVDVVAIIKMQEQSIWKLAAALAPLHEKVEQLRLSYTRQETKENVLLEADQKEKQRQQQLDHQMRLQMVKSLPQRAAPAPAQGGMFGSAPGTGMFGAPAPASGGLFGSPAPASGGLFGSTPAPASGGLFGAPAPSSGGLFGARAPAPGGFGAPAPAPGGLFGSTPAPAAGGLFGSTPAPAPGGFGAPAPAPGGLFGSTPAPAPGGFGAAPAPGAFGAAPATGGFGAPAPAAGAPAFGGFAAKPPASNTTSTPRSRNKKGGGRRR